MRLIEKIILWVLGVALVPLIITEGLLYLSAQHTIGQQTDANLSSTATIQAHRVDDVRAQNLEHLASFSSRLQLRPIIDRYNHTHTAADQAQLNAVLIGVQKSDSSVRRMVLMNPAGTVIASTNQQEVGSDLSANALFQQGRKRNNTELVDQGTGQMPVFYTSGPLVFNDKMIAVVGIETDANNLLAITQDYSGLGSTGELMLVEKPQKGPALYLMPLRFDGRAAFHLTMAGPYLLTANTTASIKDYRGVAVVAATRTIKDSDWELIAKIDRAEALQPDLQLRSELLMLAFISSVLVVFAAIIIAQHITQPILDIDEVAEEVSKGQLLDRVENLTHDEIGNLAQTFNLMLDNLEELDRAKSDFVSLASHQLRTPATGVKALIGLLLKNYSGDLSTKQRSYLKKAYASNERQLRVINDLLNIAMLDSGKMQLNKAQADIGQLISDTVAEQSSTLKSRHQSIHKQLPKQPVLATVDAEKLRMVLDNLVSNASKYTPDKGEITVALHTQERHFTVEVQDTGVGIKQKDLQKLFQKFSQVDNHLEHPGGASAGLGLYLVKKLVELHGGNISVSSQPGKGTTFTIEIPTNTA